MVYRSPDLFIAARLDGMHPSLNFSKFNLGFHVSYTWATLTCFIHVHGPPLLIKRFIRTDGPCMKHMPVISISGLIDLKLHNTLTLANTRKKCVRMEGVQHRYYSLANKIKPKNGKRFCLKKGKFPKILNN